MRTLSIALADRFGADSSSLRNIDKQFVRERLDASCIDVGKTEIDRTSEISLLIVPRTKQAERIADDFALIVVALFELLGHKGAQIIG